MNKKISIFVCIALIILAGACADRQPASVSSMLTHEPSNTYTSSPTFTATLKPTRTSRPTKTLIPTQVKTVATISPYITPSTPPPTAVVQDSEQVDYWQEEPLGREYYMPINVAKEADWASDPVSMAIRFTGYPNEEYSRPDKIFVYYQGTRVTIIIIENFLHDDSTQDVETRIDLVDVGYSRWKIEWAGWRQRCARGDYDGWTTSLCP